MIKPFDPNLELDFVSPAPEDVEAKIKEAEAASGRFLSFDEVRDMLGREPLPTGPGEQIHHYLNHAMDWSAMTDVIRKFVQPILIARVGKDAIPGRGSRPRRSIP